MLNMKHLINFATLSIFALPSCNGIPSDPNNVHHYHAPELDVISPAIKPCVSSRGWFGRVGKYEQRINYKYELTLIDGEYLADAMGGVGAGEFDPKGRSAGSRPEGLQGVFSAIETSLADSLLESNVFEEVCDGGEVVGPYRKSNGGVKQHDGGRKLMLRQGSERQLGAIGISSTPEDQILEGLTCRTFANETDGPCMVVDGEFTIYLDIYEDVDSALSGLLSDLMNVQHKFDDVHPYIERVRYISLEADQISGSIQDDAVGVQHNGNSNTLSSSFYALIAAGTFVVVGTAVFYRRRRNAAEHDGETTTLDQRTAQLQQA